MDLIPECPDDSREAELVRAVMLSLRQESVWGVWLFLALGTPTLLSGEDACEAVRVVISLVSERRVHRPSRGLSL